MNTTNKTTARYFGKCNGCKKAIVRDFTTIGGNKIPVVIGIDRYEDIFNAASLGLIRCDCGGRIGSWTALKAKFSDKHVCGAKCLASKGPCCECSCGGKNHGAGHMAAA